MSAFQENVDYRCYLEEEIRITSSGYAYGNAGNMTDDPGRSYQYDAESRIKSVNNGSVAAYQYDGNGRRAVKNSASGTRIYFFDIEGRPVAESGPTGVWLSGHAYFQNRHAFENTGSQLLWRHPDHLGTAVVRTNTDGNKICDSRFYPYGCECARVWKIEFRAWNFARTEPRQS